MIQLRLEDVTEKRNKVQYTSKQKKSEEKEERKTNKGYWEEYKKKSAVERFFSWIEQCKKSISKI